MARKKTVEKALNIDSILFNCRDYLRAARNSGSFFEKRDMMLTLVFLRFIGEKYEDGIENLKKTLIERAWILKMKISEQLFLMMPLLQTEHIICHQNQDGQRLLILQLRD